MDKYQAKELNRIAKKKMEDRNVNVFSTDGWAKTCVEAEYPIPESFRNYFYDALVSPDLGYRKELEESVRWFGVRWKKEF